ncbi:MAG: hypothetical protein HQK75_17060 [Candidatus Magnetomorum sp.]|nr:hypothetical protein [Candidatus Magnetomorum sp.]
MNIIIVLIVISILFAVGVLFETNRRKKHETEIDMWLHSHNRKLKTIKKQLKQGV